MTRSTIMKKLSLLVLLVSVSASSFAQTVSFLLTTAPCNNDGLLTVNMTGLTPPLTVSYATAGYTATTIVHTGVSGLTDALTSYSGGPVTVTATDGSGASATNHYSGAAPLSFFMMPTPAICPGLGRDSAVAFGGTAPYTYQWFNMTTGAMLGTGDSITLPAGAYGLTVTDAAGCRFGSMVDSSVSYITYTAPFYDSMETTIAGCTNGTASAYPVGGGTAPYSYLWSNGGTTPTITGLVMGIYKVTVTDAIGCIDSQFVFVNQSITVSAPVTPTAATCAASDGAVIAFGSGGAAPYTYLWSNGATTQSQTGLPAGWYGVTVTDANGCIGYDLGMISASTPITATYTSVPSLCTAPTGSATVFPTGGTGSYSIYWHTTPPQTGASANTLAPGDYYFNITDGVGCVQSGMVNVPPINIISATYTTTNAVCTLANGSVAITPTGGVTPYTYLWNTGATTSSLSSVASGYYNVTITDGMGCKISKSPFVPVYSPMGVNLLTTPSSCLYVADGSITAFPYGGTTPYAYSWSGGGSGSTLSALGTGGYSVRVTDAAGCSAMRYTYLGYNTANTSCYCTITGTVYNDINGNCSQDAGEPGLQNIQVSCSGMGYTYTDANGNYTFKVPSGSYTIAQTVLAYYPLSGCQVNNIPVTASASTGCVIPVNFANSIDTIHDMHIRTWDYSKPVPGHSYTQVTVVTNQGTMTEDSVLTGYQPDGQIFAPSVVPATVLTGFPYWYTSTTGSFPSVAPGASQSLLMNYMVPGNIPMGTVVNFKDSVTNIAPISNWLLDYSPWDNVNSFNTYVVSSYDPNFKEVYPRGSGAAGIISGDDSVLEYMVHFQNTGTFQAENVVVIDTLDDNLQWNTLRPVYYSAQCQVELTQVGTRKIAKFTFNNINLPPQTTDDLRSNGMFSYTIKTKPGLAIGTQFRNRASIYFDYNAPVVTNTTLNTLGSPATDGVANSPIGSNNSSFSLYPNPASRSFNALISSVNNGNADMKLSDVTGKTMISKTIALQKGTQTTAVDVTNLAPGMYFVSLQINGRTETQKLVIMK